MRNKISLYTMACLYIVAGFNHFHSPDFYTGIMPGWIPFHEFVVALSGICEIALGILLIPERTRRISAWLIIAMLTVFFIVHIQMLLDFIKTDNKALWLAIIRIPVQFVLIWWAYSFTKKEKT